MCVCVCVCVCDKCYCSLTAPVGKRLPFFYLANHIVHLAKQKAPQYVKLFGPATIEGAKAIAKYAVVLPDLLGCVFLPVCVYVCVAVGVLL